MDDSTRRNIKNKVLLNYFDTRESWQRFGLLCFGMVCFIISGYMFWHYYGWRMVVALFLLFVGHNIEQHMPKKDLILEQMKDEFVKDVLAQKDEERINKLFDALNTKKATNEKGN